MLKILDKIIKKDRIQIKFLLLGTGDSGKSTFFKQMRLLHEQGFTEDMKRLFVPVLRSNTLDSMKILLSACRESLNIELGETTQPLADEIMAATELTEDIAKHIESIWVSTDIQQAMNYEARNHMQLPGGASVIHYYLENAVRFAREDFLPTDYDILRAKMRTTGNLKTSFEVSGTDFEMVEMGGYRSERRKWLSFFEGMSAVIYFVALNEYDMVCEEDYETNRMEESMKLFQKLSGSKWLKDTPFILILNKSDLFEEKIRNLPLTDYFEDYEEFAKGNIGFETSCEYIKLKYIQHFGGCRLYPFITNVLDTNNCERVFLAVRDVMIKYEMII